MKKIKKPSKKRPLNVLILVCLIILIILVSGGLYIYFVMAAPSAPKPGAEVSNPIEGMSSEQALLQFNEQYIDYLVFALGAWKLHNPPFSSDTPKIKVVLGEEVFASEIIKGEIRTRRGELGEEDIVVRTTKQEIVNAILSLDMKSYIKDSIKEGKTGIEFKASETTLFVKGYLSLYEDLTGESLGGVLSSLFG